MNLDVIAGALTGFMAACLFGVHIISGRKWVNWRTLPEYLRHGFLVAGFLLMIRSVNLFSLAGDVVIQTGHANAWAVLTSLGLAYAIGGLTWWSITEYLPAHVRHRLEWVGDMMKRRPDLAPILLTPDEVAGVAHADGAAAVGPGEPAEAVYREGPRLVAAYERRDRRAAVR